jgi:hypothetical protein
MSDLYSKIKSKYKYTDPRKVSASLILEEPELGEDGFIAPRGIDTLVGKGRYNVILSPYATDTFFPRTINTQKNLLTPYLKKF